jgi:hypothetical protein
MAVSLRLVDLADLHPGLLWDTIALAAAAVLREGGREPPHLFSLEVVDVIGFGSGTLRLQLDPTGLPLTRIPQLCRTYEPFRLVELAAIAVAAAGLAVAGEHQILDLAVRGSGADYLVDAAGHRLEIAGRSRKADIEVAWQQKWQRLRDHRQGGSYVCVSEFETLTGRLGFREHKSGADNGDG